MKFWVFPALVSILLVVASVLALSAQGTAKDFQIATPAGDITISALNIQTETPGHVVKAKGNVEIRTKEMVVTANEADYHIDTADIALRGPVHVKLAK